MIPTSPIGEKLRLRTIAGGHLGNKDENPAVPTSFHFLPTTVTVGHNACDHNAICAFALPIKCFMLLRIQPYIRFHLHSRAGISQPCQVS